MNIKVCGITQVKQLQQLDVLNIDFAGLIFYKGSPRYVGDKLKGEDVKPFDLELKKVGVFVNAGYAEILERIDEYGLDIVQLHGKENPELCESLSERCEVIKVFSIGNESGSIDDMLEDYDEVCDYYLFDTAASNGTVGGTGIQFDWQKLRKCRIEKPFFLSGGISVQDVGKIKKFNHPDFYGIDVNSKFEKSPGVKDMALVLQLKQELKKKK